MTDTSRIDDLKPCPFCGDKPIIEDGANDRPWVVQCINRDCPAQPFMDHADTKRQAIAAWNNRRADRIEALEAALLLIAVPRVGGGQWASEIAKKVMRIGDDG